jgi:DNA-binding SARP family transcriptional activator/tetratricopeptide (TPR) repeat protein
MRFALLGPLTVADHHGGDRPAGSPKARTLLAVLLLAPNRAVRQDRIETALWGDRPPATARASLHNHLTRLRRALGDRTRIKAAPDGGLVLRVADGELDADAFAGRLGAARAARLTGDWDRVTRETDAALRLWRGTPLGEFPHLTAMESARIGEWHEARLQALEWRCDAEIRQGRHDGLLPELLRLTEEFPLREAFHAQLMLVLHRTGQRARALDVYRRLRRTLIDELGVEPGSAAQAAHQEILTDRRPGTDRRPDRHPDRHPGDRPDPRAEPRPDRAAGRQATARRPPAVPPPPVPPPAAPAVPATLPRDIAAFSGRDDAVRDLLAAVDARDARQDVVAVHAVDGMPGVGKTAFAVHVAHRLAGRFPDGQIFFPLHAHSPDAAPVAPADALTGLLLALGEAPGRIPDDPAARAGLWRSRLAGRRVLVILDDAASSEQVEPLLPGTPGSLVLVTSRRRLVTLLDAAPISLDVLSPRLAAELLVAKSGRPELADETEAVAELARLCGYLPLALSLSAARLRHHRSWTAADVTTDLRAAGGRSAALSAEHCSASAAFALSRRDLGADEQVLFQRLGLQPAVDFDAYAVAALQDVDLATARRMLQTLEDHHLLEEAGRGRYRMHDLVREYLRSLDATAADEAAVRRQLDYYLAAGIEAVRPVVRFAVRGVPDLEYRAPALPELADAAQGTAWLRAERLNLHAATAYAARKGLTTHTVLLPTLMKEFLRTHGYAQEALALYRTALDAARAAGSAAGEAVTLRNIAMVQHAAGRVEEAEETLRQSLALFRALPDPHGEAIALHTLAVVLRETGRYAEAAAAGRQSLGLLADAGDLRGQAEALVESGCLQQLEGRYEEAARSLERALDLNRAAGSDLGQANALAALGRLRRATGHYAESVARHRAALGLHRAAGHRLGAGTTLAGLGDVLRLTGAYDEAAACLEESLSTFRELGSPQGRATALAYLGMLRQATGQPSAAERHLREALAVHEETDSAAGRASALVRLAEAQEATGAHTAALAGARAGLALFRDLRDRGGEAQALNVLGALLRAEGTAPATAEARDCHLRALGLARAVRSPHDEMAAWEGLGECALAAGDGDGTGGGRGDGTLGGYQDGTGGAYGGGTGDGHDPGEQRGHAAGGGADADTAGADPGTGARDPGTGGAGRRAGGAAAHLRRALALARTLGVPDAERIAGRLARA